MLLWELGRIGRVSMFQMGEAVYPYTLLCPFVLSAAVSIALTGLMGWHFFLIWQGQVCGKPAFAVPLWPSSASCMLQLLENLGTVQMHGCIHTGLEQSMAALYCVHSPMHGLSFHSLGFTTLSWLHWHVT